MVAAKKVQEWDSLSEAPGTFMFDEGRSSLIFNCPCGCGEVCSVTIRLQGTPEETHPSWEWNGNEERPTLTPSILRMDGCKWHGFLTDGQWKNA